jgi:carbonic anhydrase/acetyltransferase-like protein (isoleucine patch superfamily)
MSSSLTPTSTLPIVFFEPDSDAAAEALSQALQTLPRGSLVLGLIVKVERQADEEKIVNWEFAAPETLKSLALVLPSQVANETSKLKE